MKNLGYLFLVTLFLILGVSTVDAAESNNINGKEMISPEANFILNDYMKNGYELDVSDFIVTEEKDVYDINNVRIAKYYGVETLNGEKYFAIISDAKANSTVLLGGEGIPEVFNLGEEKYYYLGGYNIVSADNNNQIVEYVKSKDEELSTKNIKNDLEVQLVTTQEIGGSYGSKLLPHTIFSQYDSNVKSGYRNSACGPTTIAVILQYWHDSRGKSKLQVYNSGYTTKGDFINSMYVNRGGSALGMSVSKVRSTGLESEVLARGYSALTSTFNNFASYKNEIDNNRPLAVKFDKYFTFFEPNADYAYDYHWTPGLGYIYASTGTMLRVQTLGTNSYIRDINYNVNSAIISMVSLTIN